MAVERVASPRRTASRGKVHTASPAPTPTQINLIYLVAFLGIGAVNSGFLVLYLVEEKRLTLDQVGIITALQPACTLLAAPGWTSLADARSAHFAVYSTTTVLAAAARTSFLGAPSFAAVVVIMVMAAVTGAGSGPMLDGAVLGTMADPNEWGKHRLWGAIGYGISVLVVGLMIDTYGYAGMFAGHAVFIITAVILVRQWLPMGQHNVKKAEGPANRRHERVPLSFAVLRSILVSSPPRIVFFSVVLFCGIGTGVIENFLFLFLQEELGASKALVGLGRTVTCISEVPMFWFAPTLIRRLGALGVLAFACVCYIIRFVAYSQLEDARWYLLVEPLHGVTYAVMWNASASYAFSLAPPGLGTTAQGLLSGVHWGLGQGVGALVGGVLYARVGPRMMFKIVTVGPLASLALIAVNAAVWAERPPKARTSVDTTETLLAADGTPATDETEL